MGTIATQEDPESATPSDEGGVRAAIVDAARKVARREGVVEMTLTAVAREASVAATDIYAFFTSKNDLLQAVVADDLATLAKTMRQSLEHPSDAVLDTAVERSQLQDTHVPPAQAAETLQDEKPYAAETVAPAPVRDRPRRFPVVQVRREPSRSSEAEADAEANAKAHAATGEAIARLQETVTRLESTPVDQWLGRRLREFERTLYGLQHNQTQRASGQGFEQGLRSLRESIDALDMRHTMAADETAAAAAERFDAFDRRLREKLSELQAESVHLAKRITALENLAFASRPEQMVPPAETFAPTEVTGRVVEPVQETTGAPYEPAQDSAAEESNDAPPSFLSAARRSADAAAQQAGDDLRRRPPAPKQNRMMLYSACALLAVLVVVGAGLGFVFRDASMQATAVHATVTPTPARAVRTVVSKPLQHRPQKAPQMNLLKLAQTGDASAELLVGLEYLEGKGKPKNEPMAVDWLSRAAAKGQPVAQYDLGALYADGRGVQADPVQAFQWFGSAALRGNRRAMHFLAIAYAQGAGTTKDLPEAARWFERAANLGAVNSQFNLAVLYERGMGVPQSLTTAYTWYAIAARQGDHESQARVAALASTLKPDALASARAAADAFKPRPLDPAANLPPKLPS